MKTLLIFLLLVFFAAFGFFYFKDSSKQAISSPDQIKGESIVAKRPIMRIGLVADSENDNENLKKSLVQVQGYGVNFVIGLGDWSNVGTIDELTRVKEILDASKLQYFLTVGDHDLWDSRNRGKEALSNFKKIFGSPSRVLEEKGIEIVILDNSDIYLGISQSDWEILNSKLKILNSKLTFVFAHKTPFHPESAHVMGEDSPSVAKQAENLLALLEEKKVDGFFSGDLHFFAKFKSPDASVRITTIGAVSADRNFQGPRFGVLTIFDDWSWEVEDIEIR